MPQDEVTTPSRVEIAMRLALVLVATVFTLLAIEVVLRVRAMASERALTAQVPPEDSWTEYDAELGWRHVPGKLVPRVYGDIPVKINSQGFRHDREYALDKTTIVALGCSFTFGHGVAASQAWPQQLERLLGRTDVEVVNMGACAYGIDQMVLWYSRERERLDANVVLLALINQDITRVGYYRWRTGHGKPRFELDGEGVRLANVPVPRRVSPGERFRVSGTRLFDLRRSHLAEFVVSRLGQQDDPQDHQSESLKISQYLLRELADQCRAEGRDFLVIQIPQLREYRSRRLRPLVRQLRDWLREQGIAVVDGLEGFPEDDDLYIADGSHLNEAGQRVVAEQVYARLREEGWPAPGTP